MTRIPMSAADTEAARQSATAAMTRAATAIRDGRATVPRPAPASLNPRTRGLHELLEREIESAASALSSAMATLELLRADMLRSLPPQRPEPAGAVVPLVVKSPPLVFGQPNHAAQEIAPPPPGTAGDDAPARTECADHPRSGD